MKKRHYLTPSDLVKIRYMIEVEGLQQWKVAELIGVHQGTIEKVVKRLGLTTQRTGPRSGDGHTNWKGGRVVRSGYVYRYAPNHPNRTKQGYVLEHRLAMEKKLGRLLLPKEVVHHVDGNRLNNDPDNLMVFGSNGKHLRYELEWRVPNWTPEGKQKILDAVRRRIDKSRLRKVSGDGQPPRPSDHSTS